LNHRGAEAPRDQLTEAVIGGAIEVHKAIGPGLLESAYRVCLVHELRLRGLSVKEEVELPVVYKGLNLNVGYRIDVVVEEKLIVELKAVEKILPVHGAQILTYMKLANIRTGLLINFLAPVIKEGIKRFRL